MLVTPEEASSQVCPMRIGTEVFVARTKKDGGTACIANMCMAWRWNDFERVNDDGTYTHGVGYCGMAGNIRHLSQNGTKGP